MNSGDDVVSMGVYRHKVTGECRAYSLSPAPVTEGFYLAGTIGVRMDDGIIRDSSWAYITLYKSSLWWRIKFLFRPHDIVFGYSDRHWKLKGADGFHWLSVGDLPDDMKREAIKVGVY